MRKYEIHKAMYYYGLALRILDIVFSRRKYNELWVSPNQGFDIYRSAGGNIPQMADEAKSFGLSDEDSLEIVCCGLLLKPLGWKNGFSVGVSEFNEREGVARMKLYLRYPGITDSGSGWRFSITINPTRVVIKPIFALPRGARESQKLLNLFGNKKSIVI